MRRWGSVAYLASSPKTTMEFSKLKKLALVAVAAGLSTQPVVAAENNVAEENYYAASCGGSKSCGSGSPKPYTQTNPAPIAEETAPSKNGVQPSNQHGQKNGSTQARYYQKRDRDVADNAANPNFNPSNGMLPNQQQKPGVKQPTKPGTSTPSSTSSSGTKY